MTVVWTKGDLAAAQYNVVDDQHCIPGIGVERKIEIDHATTYRSLAPASSGSPRSSRSNTR
jgi:hypothetical protein